jgi:hypothetical protein
MNDRPSSATQPTGITHRRLIVALTAILAVVVAGCDKGTFPSIAVQPPADTAYSYFQAFNDLNLPLLQAHLTDDQRAEPGFGGDWAPDYFDVPPKGYFQDVVCTSGTQTPTEAQVDCSFSAKQDWETFKAGPQKWRLYMKRQAPAPWLIYEFRQE